MSNKVLPSHIGVHNGGEGIDRKSGIEKVWSLQEAAHPLQEASHSSNLSGSTRSSLRAAFLSLLPGEGEPRSGG